MKLADLWQKMMAGVAGDHAAEAAKHCSKGRQRVPAVASDRQPRRRRRRSIAGTRPQATQAVAASQRPPAVARRRRQGGRRRSQRCQPAAATPGFQNKAVAAPNQDSRPKHLRRRNFFSLNQVFERGFGVKTPLLAVSGWEVSISFWIRLLTRCFFFLLFPPVPQTSCSTDSSADLPQKSTPLH